ncbi:hypothetical protein MJD09_06905 [bacterium]|nr:hypothetical protein [bacterium]
MDVALEGDWSGTVVTVWDRNRGPADFWEVTRSYPSFKPSLELYFLGAWVGIHCSKREDDKNVFDEDFARKIIEYVDKMVRGNDQ